MERWEGEERNGRKKLMQIQWSSRLLVFIDRKDKRKNRWLQPCFFSMKCKIRNGGMEEEYREKKKGWKIPLRAVVFRLRRRFDIYACIEKKERIGEMREEEREKEKRKNKKEEREKEAHAIEGLYSLESARTLLIRSRTVNWILYEDNEVDDTQYISGPTAIFCRAGGRFYKKGFRSPI